MCAVVVNMQGKHGIIVALNTYQISRLVWTQCEYFTSYLPWCAKSAKMELLSLGACLLAIAALIASSPKWQRVWCLRLAVDALFFES